MTEEYTCIECENLYDDTDGDTDERMCDKCLDIIYDESLERKSEERVKSVMGKVDELIDWVKGERRNPNIRRSSTKHYPDWDMKKKEYIVPPNKRKKRGVTYYQVDAFGREAGAVERKGENKWVK